MRNYSDWCFSLVSHSLCSNVSSYLVGFQLNCWLFVSWACVPHSLPARLFLSGRLPFELLAFCSSLFRRFPLPLSCWFSPSWPLWGPARLRRNVARSLVLANCVVLGRTGASGCSGVPFLPFCLVGSPLKMSNFRELQKGHYKGHRASGLSEFQVTPIHIVEIALNQLQVI